MALQYVVLRHDGIPDPHFDLMFETADGSVLATWRSPSWPPRADTPLTPLPDHRSEYLTYEGPVSGGRGSVRRVASGGYAVRHADGETLVVELDTGEVLRLPCATPFA